MSVFLALLLTLRNCARSVRTSRPAFSIGKRGLMIAQKRMPWPPPNLNRSNKNGLFSKHRDKVAFPLPTAPHPADGYSSRACLKKIPRSLALADLLVAGRCPSPLSSRLIEPLEIALVRTTER